MAAALHPMKSVCCSSSARGNMLVAPPAARRAAAVQPATTRSRHPSHIASRDLGHRQVVAVAQQEQAVEEAGAESDAYRLPPGYHWYETMMILKITLSGEERDRELARFEAFLNKEECIGISALVRSGSRLAYPIKNCGEGMYVLYNYAAKRQTARVIQSLLSNPESGSEDNVLRHITFCKS